jgi:cytochrome c oxidase cbb3-type subunit 3
MFKEILNSISGIEIWPIIGLFLFMGLFAGIVVWVFRLDKRFIKKMEELPLEEDSLNNGEQKHG